MLTGLFVAEGTSDEPLAEIVTNLFMLRGVEVRLSKPNFAYLDTVEKDVTSRVEAGVKLIREEQVDLIVAHRDADNAGAEARRREIESAARAAPMAHVIPIIPVRMTEAWLLLDESAIRQVAGNPRGRNRLPLPKPQEVERIADPKNVLQECLVKAADCGGRRRERVAKRFSQHRRQLLERLDCNGAVTELSSWKQMVMDVERATRDVLGQA